MATPPVGRHGIVSVNEEKPRKLPQLECHPLSSMRVKIELLTPSASLPRGSPRKKRREGQEESLASSTTVCGSALEQALLTPFRRLNAATSFFSRTTARASGTPPLPPYQGRFYPAIFLVLC